MVQNDNGQSTILVVDDDGTSLAILEKMLIHHGYRVHRADNGQLALEKAREILPDLILLDIVMPGMDGLEVCSRLKADENTADLPIVFISALDNPLDIVNAFKAGGVDYITKPIQPEEVIARVQTQLDMRSMQAKLQVQNRHLEQVVTKLTQREEELERYHHHLEELVNERTDALRKTNTQLEQEVAERKRTEIALASEKEKLAAALQEMTHMRWYLKNVVDSMPSILVGVNRQGQITHWNRQAEEMTGISSNEACGNQLPPIFLKFNLKSDQIKASIRKKKGTKLEKVAHKVDGETHFADIMIYPLIANGTEGAVIRVDDVTARVRIENMMVHTEKMLSVGGLAAGMAHEINNPLSSILQSVQNTLLRLSIDHPKNREAAEAMGVDLTALQAYLENRGIVKFLEAIRESGRKASYIVEDMLNFSRKSESPMAVVPLAELLDKAIELAAHDYDLKKKYDFGSIEIVKDFAPDIPPARCMAPEIEQVVLNLLRNAAQAMMDDRIDHKSPRIVLRMRKEGELVCLEVEDNGPGMDEAVRKRAFEPFFTTKAEGVGTGLGLSVSYFIITQNHRGTMGVESEPDKGTRFTIRIPIGEQGI